MCFPVGVGVGGNVGFRGATTTTSGDLEVSDDSACFVDALVHNETKNGDDRQGQGHIYSTGGGDGGGDAHNNNNHHHNHNYPQPTNSLNGLRSGMGGGEGYPRVEGVRPAGTSHPSLIGISSGIYPHAPPSFSTLSSPIASNSSPSTPITRPLSGPSLHNNNIHGPGGVGTGIAASAAAATMGDLGTPLTEIGSPADIEMDHYVEEDEVDGGFSYVRALDRRGGKYCSSISSPTNITIDEITTNQHHQ